YDIFGLGPAVARKLESIAPVGEVLVSRPLCTLLCDVPGFILGEEVRESHKERILQTRRAKTAGTLLS
ncbi:hypothetical protein KIPB_015673, partial [Kipferlia bialata]